MAQRRSVESIQSRPSTPQPQDSSLSEPHPDQSAQDEGKHRHHLQQKLRSPAPQPDQDKPQPLPPGPSPSASPAPALLVPQPSSAGSAQAQTYSSSTPGTATTATTTTSTAVTTTSSTPTPDLQQPSKDASSVTSNCTPPVEIVETGAGQSSVRSGDQGIATDSASTITATAATTATAITNSTHQDPRAPSESAPPLADTVPGQHPQYHQHQIGAPHNGSAPRVLVPTPMSHPQQQPGPPTPRQTPTMNYPAPSPYPPAGMPPGAQYAYGAQVAHVDPYRTSQTALPSMRTFDHVQQQQQHAQHQMPLPNHMTVSMAPQQMSYYAPMHPAYQMHPGQGVVHYALTGLTPDPRIALSGGRHKKVPIHCTAIARRHT